MRSILLLWACFSSCLLIAQKEINYIAPPAIKAGDCMLYMKDIVSKKDYCKLRLTVENNGNDFYAFKTNEVEFEYDAYTYAPKKNKLKIIKPGGKIIMVPRVEGNFDFRHDNFMLNIKGMRKAAGSQVVELPQITMVEGADVSAGGVSVVVKKADHKKGKLTFALEVQYNGDPESFVRITTSDFQVVEGGAAGRPTINGKEEHLLENGDKITITGSHETPTPNAELAFNASVQHYLLSEFHSSSTPILREGTVAKATRSTVQETPVARRETKNVTQTTTTTTTRVPAQSCAPVQAGGNGKVKVNFFNAERHCFIMYVNGALISEQYTANLTFRTDPGKKMLELHFQDGHVVSKNIQVYPQYLEAGWRVKPKKSTYVINSVLSTIVQDPNYESPAQTAMENNNSRMNNNNNNSSFQSSSSYTETRSSSVNGRTTTTTTTTRSSSNGDNVNISVGADGDNTNMNIGENGIGITTPDGETFGISINGGGNNTRTTTTTTTTNATNNTRYDDGYRGRKNCMEPNTGSGYFNDLKRRIKDEITDFSKIDVAIDGVRGRCLNTDQIVQLTELFSSDSSKLKFAKAAYSSAYDADNYYKVVDLLTFSSNKDELRQYIR